MPACARSCFFLQVTLAAVRRELPDRHITANKGPHKTDESIFDPGETFKSSRAVIIVGQTTR